MWLFQGMSVAAHKLERGTGSCGFGGWQTKRILDGPRHYCGPDGESRRKEGIAHVARAESGWRRLGFEKMTGRRQVPRSGVPLARGGQILATKVEFEVADMGGRVSR
jgi:hypothetical protein